MLRDALQLLELFTVAYPPPDGQQHSLTLPTDECPESAELRLTLRTASRLLDVHLEAPDLERPPEALFLEIRQHLLSNGENLSSEAPEGS